MEYRGISFDVKMGARIWVWVVHTPKERRGEVRGSREDAVARARKSIDGWHDENSGDENSE